MSNEIDMGALRRLVEIDKRRKEIEAEDKQLSAERMSLQDALISQFEQCGMDRATVDGRTVYVRVQLWARAKEGMMTALCGLLADDEETQTLVSETVNTSKLSAHFRERLDALMTSTQLSRSDVLEYIKQKYDGALELADQITLQSRGK